MKSNQYRLMYELEDSHWWFIAKRHFIASQLPEINPHWKILDLGCGTGGLSKYLGKWGDVTRIENSPDAFKYLKLRRLPFQRQDINTFSKSNNTYNLICIFDVLYHRNIKNDIDVLQNAYSLLKPGGILLVTDSAIPWLYSYHDTENMARERYLLNELNQKISSVGFTVTKKSYIYFLIFPIFFIIRLATKFIQFEDVGKVNPIINNILKTICKLESKILKFINFPIGSSVILKAIK
jgi:SAM-dependent methyltransferase